VRELARRCYCGVKFVGEGCQCAMELCLLKYGFVACVGHLEDFIAVGFAFYFGMFQWEDLDSNLQCCCGESFLVLCMDGHGGFWVLLLCPLFSWYLIKKKKGRDELALDDDGSKW
jgi:hypothetical protein